MNTRTQHKLDVFERKLGTTLKTLRRVLDSHTAQPVLASATEHTYDDKFALAELVSSLTVASWLHILEQLGLERDALLRFATRARAGNRITLRTRSVQYCKLLRSAKREVASDFKVQETTATGVKETQVVRTEVDHVWEIGHEYSIVVFSGATDDSTTGDRATLAQRAATSEIVTKTERPPFPESRSLPTSDCDITWLLSQLVPPASEGASPSLTMTIDRSAEACKTPRRNPLIVAALETADEFKAWAKRLSATLEFGRTVARLDVSARAQPAPSPPQGSTLFVPVLPLLQPPFATALAGGATDTPSAALVEQVEPPPGAKQLTDVADTAAAAQRPPLAAEAGDALATLASPGDAATADGASPPLTLSTEAMRAVLSEERRTLAERRALIGSSHPAPASEGALLSSAEIWLTALATHASVVLEQYAEALEYIEDLLRVQLVAAIGKEVTADDFATYMRFHASRLFRSDYAPQPFCFAVRLPDRSPEGTISMEMSLGGGPDAPIETIVRKLGGGAEGEPVPPMSFALDAATRVTFRGDRYVHAFVDHSFAERSATASPRRTLTLCMRARQFSSFLVVLGRLGPGGTLEPQHAMLIRNKDDMRLPLLLEQMPSAKEFADAIASLSPDQQRFARAYRAMQLEGSVFGLLVVQLKPQLEALLRLPPDSLTKQIALTQKLLELFIEYQIPSDLLAYDGSADAPTGAKLDAVAAHVRAIVETLDAAKKAELDGARQQYAFANPGSNAFGAAQQEAGPFSTADDGDGGFGFSSFGACEGAAGQLKGFGGGRPGGGRGGGKGGKGGGGIFAGQPLSAPVPQMRSRGGASFGASVGASPAGASCAEAAKAMSSEVSVDPWSVQATVKSKAAPAPLAAASASQPSLSSKLSSMQPPLSPFDDEAVDLGGSLELDLTKLPTELDAKLAELDVDAAMRPTKIVIGEVWTRSSVGALLATTPKTSTLRKDDQEAERKRAFDLLDALSRSGSLPIEECSLHVVIAATHCFDQSLMDTVIVQNVNPIEKMERSALIVAELIHGTSAPTLIRRDALERVRTYAAPALFPREAED